MAEDQPLNVSVGFLLGCLLILVVSGAQCSTVVKKAPQGGGTQGGGTEQAKLGDAIVLKGAKTEVAVTVEDVVDPVQTAGYDKPLSKNARYVGVEVALKNTGRKTYQDAPGNGATLILSDKTQASSALVATGTCGSQFSSNVTLGPGSEQRGCLPFEVPQKAEPDTLQFVLDSGFGPETGEWALR